MRMQSGYEEVKYEKVEAKKESDIAGSAKEKEVLKHAVKRGRPAKK